MEDFEHNSNPIYKIGLVADVQYADIEDGVNFEQTNTRYYRNSLNMLEKAVFDWVSENVSIVINLGDIIDGKNAQTNQSHETLMTVLRLFAKTNVPVFHIWGNHEFYNFTRSQLLLSKEMNPGLVNENVSTLIPGTTSYFNFSPIQGLRIILLDTYEISMLGYSEESKSYQEAERILERNPNFEKNNPNGLSGFDQRFVKFNGGISDTQLNWLDSILRNADINMENVLITGHCQLIGECKYTLCWNLNDILNVINKYNCVFAYICGHNHEVFHGIDDHGLHHITMPGIIETYPNDISCHSILTIFKHKALIKANSKLEEIQIDLPYPLEFNQLIS